MKNRPFYALVAIGVLLNATGLFPLIMEIDGALYASIAKQMAQTGDFVNLYAVGTDWLDKPHLPFWVAALSFKLFGITTFAYKFPALLFFLGSVVYTYQFARLMYPKAVAQVAALVLLTAFHGILSNSDVRAEPYLMPLIIGAVYHFFSLTPTPLPKGEGPIDPDGLSPSPKGRGVGVRDLLLGSLLTACALMTKGVFVLIPIGAGLVLHWLITGNWRELLKPRWYVAVLLSFVFTLPEIYTLYRQFDLQPEKVVFGETGVSGVKFFFWDSQFGRFFNTGPIKGEGDPFFFVHTLLWAFIPWSLPLYAGVGKSIIDLIKRRFDSPEYVSLGSGLAAFLLFSFSGFQLPHYMNIVFPFFAILTARFLVGLPAINLRRWATAQTLIGLLLVGVMMALLWLVQPAQPTVAIMLAGLITVASLLIFRQRTLLTLAGRMMAVMLVLAVSLNLFLYPTFLRYQAGSSAALYANAQPALARQPTILYEPGTGVGGGSFWSYEFYADAPTQYARSDSALRTLVQRGPRLTFTTAELADSLSHRGFGVQRLAAFPFYHISQLTADFLNPTTRPQMLSPYVLASISEL